MHIDETTQPDSPPQPVETQPTLPNLLLGRTLDKTVESQRRRLLAVSIPQSLTREDVGRADEALDQLSLAFFSAPNESLANAFGAALKSAKRLPKAALVAADSHAFDGGLVAAALDGQRLVVSAADPGRVIVQQGDQIFSFPRQKDAGDEFLDPAATIFETKLDPGDIVALLSGGDFEDRDNAERLTRAEVADITGPKGAWVWIELEKAKKGDLRQRAGLRSAPEPEAQRIWSTTAQPADPLWAKNVAADGAMFQKPPAIDTLNRYRSTSGDSFSRGARARLPRGRPSALLLGAIVLVVLLVGGGFGYLYANRPQGAALPDPEIPKHTAALAAALSGNDPAAIEAVLPAAERALTIGKQTNLPDDQLAVLSNEVLQAHDRLEGVLRLGNVALVGRLPDGADDRDPRLAEASGVLYLLDPGPLQIDLDRLTMLSVPFAPGSAIRSFTTQVAASDVAGVIASDGSRLVLMDFDGNATEIGVTTWPEGVDATAGIVSGFQNRLYLFDQESGEIWVADGQDNVAYRWLSDSEPPLQTGALGLEINGAIHAVYPDGRIVSMSSGEVYNRMELGATSNDFEVLAVDSGDESGNLYLATLADGSASLEIVELGDGTVSQVLLPPESIDGMTIDELFDDVSSLVVSEARGQIYWIADGAIWSATLPDMPSDESGQ
ncbi:MAG TPA: hypothetical protein VFP05_05210 [Thermomicrobiales bacterium]|nr:hypothetical protein [Thermomicrobiales bacterium]